MILPAAAEHLRRWGAPEALSVAPGVAGPVLATPPRRALGMGLDLLLIALLSDVAGVWLVCGLALTLVLRLKRPGGSRYVMIGWGFAGFLSLVALHDAW